MYSSYYYTMRIFAMFTTALSNKAFQETRKRDVFLSISSSIYIYIYIIYLLTAIGLSPGGSSTVHIYPQTIHRTTQNKEYTE